MTAPIYSHAGVDVYHGDGAQVLRQDGIAGTVDLIDSHEPALRCATRLRRARVRLRGYGAGVRGGTSAGWRTGLGGWRRDDRR